MKNKSPMKTDSDMLRGIDVSSWQGDIQVQNMSIDFVITKATEGLNYVNPYCDPVIQRCISGEKMWGFYHFARENDASAEAKFFLDNCKNYFGEGIPVLDWETTQSVDWVNTFVNVIHRETNVWPWIYANPWRFRGQTVELNCARWLAQYPPFQNPTLDIDLGTCPEVPGLVAAWQYASDGRVPGYDGNLDLNHFYGTHGAWMKYVQGDNQQPQGACAPCGGELPEPIILENEQYKVEITPK